MIKDLNSDKFLNESHVDGELIYEGSNVMMGYATKIEDLSTDDKLQGVLHTGDIAQKDDDGYYYITGRLKRFIKIHGNRVGLDEIEHYLKSKDYDVLCTGIDNKLMIVTRDNTILDDMKNDVISKYAFHHSVVKVKYIKAVEVTPSAS